MKKCPECGKPRETKTCWRLDQDKPCRRDKPTSPPLNPPAAMRPSDR